MIRLHLLFSGCGWKQDSIRSRLSDTRTRVEDRGQRRDVHQGDVVARRHATLPRFCRPRGEEANGGAR